jgi:hypothetical protein
MTITLRTTAPDTISIKLSNTGKNKDEAFYIGRAVESQFKHSKLTVEKNTSRNLFLTYKGTFKDAELLVGLLRSKYIMKHNIDKLIWRTT